MDPKKDAGAPGGADADGGDAGAGAESGAEMRRIIEAGMRVDGEPLPYGADDKPPAPPAEPGDGTGEPPAPPAEPEAGEPGPEDEGAFQDGELEGLSARAQAKVNERIHELNVRRKNAETAAETTKARLAELEGKQDASFLEVAKKGLAPEYVNEAESKQIQRYEKLKAWNRWLALNAAGYEGAEDDKDDPSWTAAQVAEAKLKVEEELMELGPAVRTLWTDRIKLMQADLKAGRELRLKKVGTPPPAAPGARRAPAMPPKLPEGGGATRRPPAGAAGNRAAGFDRAEFEKEGADKAALNKQFEKLFGG